MLLAIEYLGGFVLLILLGRMPAFPVRRRQKPPFLAWRDASTVPQNVVVARKRIRLVTGCLAIGLALGYWLKGGFPDVLSAFADPSSKTWLYFVGIPLLLIVLILFLARLRREFVD